MEKMKAFFQKLSLVLLSLGIAALILVTSAKAATSLRESSLMTQSQVVRSILADDAVGISSFLTSKEKRGMLRGFVKAVTDAYVSFELIPVNEGKTFATIFQSINDDIIIDEFTYHRRDLRLHGHGTKAGYEEFVQSLEKSNYFYQVIQISVTETEVDEVEFTLDCQAEPISVQGVFTPAEPDNA